MFLWLSFVLITIAGFVNSGSLPPFITPCSISDPNINRCIEDVIHAGAPQFAQGMPSLGIEPLDPLAVGSININENNLKIKFDNTVVTGLKNTRLKYFRINPSRNSVAMQFVSNVTMKANYNIDGNIFLLPIKGNGPSKIKITNLEITLKYDYEVVPGRDGAGYWNIKRHEETYKVGRAVFKFQNLFGNTNKELANTVDQVINMNWEVVMNNVAPPAVKQIVKACIGIVNKFFATVPVNEITRP